jgi:sugar phosphate isomerase/epimerase
MNEAPNYRMGLMSSAFPGKKAGEVIDVTADLGMQGVEFVSIRQGGVRQDHIATHLELDQFARVDAQQLIDKANSRRVVIETSGTYANTLGGTPEEQRAEWNQILLNGRAVASLRGKNGRNDVVAGYFPGWDPKLGDGEYGFQRNLEKWSALGVPVLKYLQDNGVILCSENCPGEGLRQNGARFAGANNNLASTLAARKMMYAMANRAGCDNLAETHDASHHWDGADPARVILASDPKRVKRVHIKSYLELPPDHPHRILYGTIFPKQAFDGEMAELAKELGIPVPGHDWDRFAYDCRHPGFGAEGSVKWTEYLAALRATGYKGPLINENEAGDSKGTGSEAAIKQGLTAAMLYFAPKIWPLTQDGGYNFDDTGYVPMEDAAELGRIVTIEDLVDQATLQKWLV